MKKIIIAIDSFKGCLTSAEAGKAAEKGIKSINPSCHTSVIPIADGGEGLLDVLITATKGKYITLSAHGPLMKMAKTHYGLSGNGRTAIIEMAAISGLPLVPIEQRNPMLTTTFGTGELIKDALNKGPNVIRFRHYGRFIQDLIKIAVDYPEGDEKKQLIKYIANHMKKDYINFNKDGVEDQKILEDLCELSEGRIKLTTDDLKLVEQRSFGPRRRQMNNNNQQKKKY